MRNEMQTELMGYVSYLTLEIPAMAAEELHKEMAKFDAERNDDDNRRTPA